MVGSIDDEDDDKEDDQDDIDDDNDDYDDDRVQPFGWIWKKSRFSTFSPQKRILKGRGCERHGRNWLYWVYIITSSKATRSYLRVGEIRLPKFKS